MTAFKPRWCAVRGTDHADVYIRPGDPVGTRHHCAASMALLFGPFIHRMKPGQSFKAELTGRVLGPVESIDHD
jgi:hypothetical protein